ncbi:hypothetical protein SNOG_11980 [Parastagonospora nodorum SN15]|uniref:Uncharacterized protein n=1 Tax=Phaeosphaeria nodorum (strain SN15 / ATCC MYA-4574 / FGSC 10173) TaxID=321614 RepID=Q0U8D4_PHANO|nr:hypothetical protein SNOG_11980 [Parastagonospora nodorum SN15]EAT80392.1 hypothetical protein SNOG_11980 [Parastagonospora nodorum SN15]
MDISQILQDNFPGQKDACEMSPGLIKAWGFTQAKRQSKSAARHANTTVSQRSAHTNSGRRDTAGDEEREGRETSQHNMLVTLLAHINQKER